jgi:hypothetical protein
MAPGKQTIEVANLPIELVVFLRSNGDDAVWANSLDVGSHFENAPVGDFFAISDLHERELALCRGVDKDGGDDERTEVVAFPGFVDADALN